MKILITGSTDGIGKIAAELLAEKGHQILIHGRNDQKLKDVLASLQSISPNTKHYSYQADLSQLNHVESLAEEVSTNHSQIDVLINNAGVYNSLVSTNPNGFDIRFTVNYFAPLLLTQKLLPLLEKSTAPRIINLSSAAQASVDLSALSGKKSINEREAYAQSKLALTMWSFYLSQQDIKPTVIPVNPGSLLNTNMVREAFNQVWGPAEKGAKILEELATSDKYEGVTGEYSDNDQGSFGQAHPDAYNPQKIQELIDCTEEVLGGV